MGCRGRAEDAAQACVVLVVGHVDVFRLQRGDGSIEARVFDPLAAWENCPTRGRVAAQLPLPTPAPLRTRQVDVRVLVHAIRNAIEPSRFGQSLTHLRADLGLVAAVVDASELVRISAQIE